MVLLVRTAAKLGRGKQALRFIVNNAMMPPDSKVFRGYTPTRADVFVATFPKSGTNWGMQICQQIAHRGAAEFDHIHEVVCWPEAPMPDLVKFDDPGPLKASPTGLRVIKTHLRAGVVPYTADAKYFTIIRDPKEVTVSSYLFLLGLMGIRHLVTPAQWVDWWCDESFLGGAWAEHTNGYWGMRDRPNVVVRSFNQVKADLGGTIDAVAELMGVDLSASERAAVGERGSFAYMKAHESQFGPPPIPLSRPDQAPQMIRRGAVGGSSELIDAEQRARIDEFSRAQLRKIGSDFPYDEMF
ncbi:Sulfotransferase domain protein [Enhygromyxa salina]|uniref:Sulfotransferase domain protein n=2 Tax=Enhygromyxa salina TaxID=215803 RepID=A0A2S9YMW3_9BACT|nr:Sulfotransferase domain protein [Enhygromyxa salina]